MQILFELFYKIIENQLFIVNYFAMIVRNHAAYPQKAPKAPLLIFPITLFG